MSEKKPGCESSRIVDDELRQAGVRLPVSVNELLNALVNRANDAGAKSSRQELVAALLVRDAELSGEELVALVLTYRQAAVKDILAAAPEIRTAPEAGSASA